MWGGVRLDDNAVSNLQLEGIGVSPGISKGKVYLLDRGRVEVEEVRIHDHQVEEEIRRFRRALAESKKQLEEVCQRVKSTIGKEHLYIIETHQLILDDRFLVEETERMIREDKINAEWALKKVLQSLSQIFEEAEDDYLRERQGEIQHVGNRIQRNLM